MDQDQQQKTRVNSNPRNRPTHEDLRNMLKKLHKMMDKLGYGPSRQRFRASPTRCQADGIFTSASTSASAPAPAPASAPSDLRGLLKRRVNYDQYEVPVFNIYEEFHKKVLQSLENISVVLNIDGKVVFLSQNVSPLLGHRPEDIVGKSLLNIVLDEEKEVVSQKIVHNLPLATSVGKLIEFCCYVRKGNAGQDLYDDKGMNKGDIFEYVKFILYLQDAYDESFVFFGNYGPNSRSIWSSSPKLLWEQQYYLVGTISVLRKCTGSERAVENQPEVIVIDSDDDDVQFQRIVKPSKRNRMERKCKTENLNMECPELVTKHTLHVQELCENPTVATDPQPLNHSTLQQYFENIYEDFVLDFQLIEVEIEDIEPVTQQMPFELVPVRTPSPSSTCTNVSVITNTSTTTSISSTECLAPSDSTSQLVYVIDPKYMLEPLDIEFEVPPDFLLNDSEDEQLSPKQECSNEDVIKPLEEAKSPNPKEHVIDEALGASSDEYFCVIAENTEVKKSPKIEELTADQGQGNQKTVEKAPLSTAVKPVRRPEAVVEPMMRTDLPSSNVAEIHLPSSNVAEIHLPSSNVAEIHLPSSNVAEIHLPSSNVAEPDRPFCFPHQFLGERFSQLCGQQVREQTYDMSANSSVNEEQPSYRNIQEENREQEQCGYALAQCTEILHSMPYERPMAQQQMRQEQENCEYWARDQMMTVFNDVGPLSINFFGNDNSEYLQNETNRSWDSCAELTPVQHLSLTRSWQRSPVPRQPVAVTHQPLAATNNPLSVSLHTLTTVPYHSSLTSSDNRSESGLYFLPSSQENPDYFQAEEDIHHHP